MFLFLNAAPIQASPQISASTDVATAGYFNLDWDGEAPFKLERSSSDEFSDAATIYSGNDQSSVISGLANGSYFFRVTDASQVSSEVKVQVAHHSLQRAFSFFALGAVIFVITLFVLFRGNKA